MNDKTKRYAGAQMPLVLAAIAALLGGVLIAGPAAADEPASGRWLRVSDNHRFLVREDGRPFFWLGDTAWELFHRLDQNDSQHYLKTRSDQGFNVIQCVLLGEMQGIDVAAPGGHLPLIDRDPAQPNAAYFQHVDRVVDQAEKLGIYLAILPTWGSYVHDAHQADRVIFTEQNAAAYGHFLGERYKDRWNIIWVLGGDRVPTGKESLWNAMATGIKQGDDGRHLMTYHVCGEHSSSEFWHDADWLDFNMLQSGHSLGPFSNNYDYIHTDYEKEPTKPTLDGEPLYEAIPMGFVPQNGRATSHHVRANAYWSVFAGAFGHTYGANGVFQMCSPEQECEFWADTPWRDAMHFEGGEQMQYLKHLMLSRPYLHRIPSQQSFTPVPIPGAVHPQLTRDGTPGQKDATYMMVYFPYVTWTHQIRTSEIPSKRLTLWWYDPRTGKATPLGDHDNTGTLSFAWKQKFSPPSNGPDWILVIDDADANYPPPGEIER